MVSVTNVHVLAIIHKYISTDYESIILTRISICGYQFISWHRYIVRRGQRCYIQTQWKLICSLFGVLCPVLSPDTYGTAFVLIEYPLQIVAKISNLMSNDLYVIVSCLIGIPQNGPGSSANCLWKFRAEIPRVGTSHPSSISIKRIMEPIWQWSSLD